MPYNHQEIEKKWQSRWDESGVFEAKDDSAKEKFYCLIEFPYPSDAGLHIGHPRSYVALDTLARKRRHQGMNVLYPIGYDAFGLPTENYAIKTGRKPQEITKENTDTFRRQLKSLGLSFDWSREINTTDPGYYKWTQWMFLEFFKAGLAYKAVKAINWCLSCKIGLANEEVVNGACERCGGEVEKRDKEQWMIAITKYAERLLEDLDGVDYLEKIKTQQRNWIGKSEGALIQFEVANSQGSVTPYIKVFTTRADTLDGATFMVLAPEHELVDQIYTKEQGEQVRAYQKEAAKKNDRERGNEEREKTGVFTGAYAINPLNQEKIPVWIADYVLMGYGTGAIMAVPQHDERDCAFAENFGIAIEDRPLTPADEVIKKIGAKKTTNYKLRDWVFSRQRYWGEPIPLVHCQKCSPETKGWIPVPVDQLPVLLPEVEKYEPTDDGESPLSAIESFVNTECPACGGPAKRETDTMPNWAGSSWYFLRYADPHNTESFAEKDKLDYWMPVDLYNGGMEHTVLHLLYSRFWHKFLFDQGYVSTKEPYVRRHSHGLVLAEDGTKMSKSKGNGVNPDEIVTQYGADSLRMYILFMGPFEEPVPWSLNGLIGVRRFLDKVMRYVTDWKEPSVPTLPKGGSGGVAGNLERALKKVSDDIEAFKFNTTISAFMSLFNEIGDTQLTRDQLKRLLTVLCPFAPHLANEAWEMIGEKGLVEEQAWPEFDESLLVRETIEMGVQINGKVRGSIVVAPEASEEAAREEAMKIESIQKHLEGKEVVKVIYKAGMILNLITN